MPYIERGRPPELADGKNVTLYLSQSLLDEAKKSGMNISEICREAISQALNSPMHKQRNEINKRIDIVPILKRRLIKHRIQEDPKTAEAWAKFIKNKFDIEVSQNELKVWSGYVTASKSNQESQSKE